MGTFICWSLRHGHFLSFLLRSSVNFLGECFECMFLCMWLVLWVLQEYYSQINPNYSGSPCYLQHLFLSGTVDFNFSFPSIGYLFGTLVLISHLYFFKCQYWLQFLFHASQFLTLCSSSWLLIFWYLLYQICQSAFVYRKLINIFLILIFVLFWAKILRTKG